MTPQFKDALNKSEVLSEKEEQKLFRAIKMSREAAQMLKQDGLTDWEIRKCEAIVGQGVAARERILLCNMHIIKNIRSIYNWKGEDALSDLTMSAIEFLMHAIDRFDPDSGCRFYHYAKQVVAKEIIHMVSSFDTLIPISPRANRGISQVSRYRNTYNMLYAADPTIEEISRATGYSIHVLKRYPCRPLISSDSDENIKPESDDDIGYRYRYMQNYYTEKACSNSVEQTAGEISYSSLLRLEVRKQIIEILETELTEMQQKIIDYRFGLFDEHGIAMTAQEVAQKLGITEQEVNRECAIALTILETPIAERGLYALLK